MSLPYLLGYYLPKDQFLKVSREKILRIGRVEKLSFFESAILDYGWFFSCFIPIKISLKLTGYHGWDLIFMIIMISRKKLGGYRVMNNTVHQILAVF